MIKYWERFGSYSGNEEKNPELFSKVSFSNVFPMTGFLIDIVPRVIDIVPRVKLYVRSCLKKK